MAVQIEMDVLPLREGNLPGNAVVEGQTEHQPVPKIDFRLGGLVRLAGTAAPQEPACQKRRKHSQDNEILPAEKAAGLHNQPFRRESLALMDSLEVRNATAPPRSSIPTAAGIAQPPVKASAARIFSRMAGMEPAMKPRIAR